MQSAARELIVGQVYHQGSRQVEIFCQTADFSVVVHLIGEAKQRCPVKVLTYCLMPNYLHLLVNRPMERI